MSGFRMIPEYAGNLPCGLRRAAEIENYFPGGNRQKITGSVARAFVDSRTRRDCHRPEEYALSSITFREDMDTA
jgi:hypothetical protein